MRTRIPIIGDHDERFDQRETGLAASGWDVGLLSWLTPAAEYSSLAGKGL